ncbi:MAG TPA: hypothetical protein VEF04_02300, partial [Blastocatellia bacterium]|nr:hypothetical protein [Blastocatellia bacterium]
SRTMLEGILAKEEEHADELADLLFAVEPEGGAVTRKLYFKDEMPSLSNAGQEIESSTSGSTSEPDKSKQAMR